MVEVYNKTKKCEPVSFLVTNENNQILGSLVAITFTEKNGILKSLSTHTTIRGGPIVDDSEAGFKICQLLLTEYEKKVKNSIYTRIYPLKQNKSAEEAVISQNYVSEGYLNFLIDLNRSEEEIMGGLHKGKRKNIRRAQQRKDLRLEHIKDRDEIPIFYDILKETHSNAEIPLADISLFFSVYDILVPKKLAHFVFAYKDEKPVACRLLLTYKKEIIDWYAASYKESHSYHPNDFLVWQIICWGIENGYKLFDFGGAGVPEEDYGPRVFKSEFGGTEVNYGRFTKVHHPNKMKLAHWGYKKASKYLFKNKNKNPSSNQRNN